jgi:hypothetical protein
MAKSRRQADVPPAAAATGRIGAGKPGPTVPIDRPALQRLFTAAASERPQEIWVRDDSELLVHVGRTTLTLADGLVLVRVPVMCNEVGSTVVEIPFAVGSKERPAGMIAATEDHPRGDERLMALWGEPLVAFAWRALLKVAAQAAAAVGVDADGNALIPIALSASPDALVVQTLARHSFDRVRP